MNKAWQDDAWEDYLYWQTQDKKNLKRINLILKDIDRNGYEGLGKPEPLSGNLNKYSFLPSTHLLFEIPLPVTIEWMWGWNSNVCPHVCKTDVIPTFAPSHFVSFVSCNIDSDVALNNMS